ncbi:MAG: hypothetical protein ACP5GU_05935 [Thermoprotei archaeon]
MTKGFAIAAGNPLLGVSNFLVVTLPDDYNIKIGEFPTEVNNSIILNNVKWVIDGDAYHYIYNNNHGYQLKIKVRNSQRKIHQIQEKILENGEFTISSHKASYSLVSRSIGFIKKQQIQVLNIHFYCDHTNRTIELEIMGKDILSELKNFISNLKESICH